MELILLIGIPGCGKSTFYKQHFFHSHLRVNLDMLRTRNRERLLLDFCFKTQLRLVVDNTNVTVKDRLQYIQLAKQYKFKTIGFYFQSNLKDCLERNGLRVGKERIDDRGVVGKFHQLQLPSYEEGFDELRYVSLNNGQFNVSPWQTEDNIP